MELWCPFRWIIYLSWRGSIVRTVLITSSKCGFFYGWRVVLAMLLINGFPNVLCCTLHYNKKCWQKLFCSKCCDGAIHSSCSNPTSRRARTAVAHSATTINCIAPKAVLCHLMPLDIITTPLRDKIRFMNWMDLSD